MQIDPIKPTLKPPGTEHMKPNYDKLLLEFAFKFNLRHSIEVLVGVAAGDRVAWQLEAGAHSRPLFSST